MPEMSAPPAHDPGAQRVAVLLPLAQGQIMAQLGEADGLVNKTLGPLALSVAMLTAVGAYRLADQQLNWWYLPAAGLGLSALLFFRALLPGPNPALDPKGAVPSPPASARSRSGRAWLGRWGNGRLDTGQPPEVLYEGVRALTEVEAYRYVLGTLQDAISFNRAAVRWQSHLLARGEVGLAVAVLGGGLTLIATNVIW